MPESWLLLHGAKLPDLYTEQHGRLRRVHTPLMSDSTVRFKLNSKKGVACSASVPSRHLVGHDQSIRRTDMARGRENCRAVSLENLQLALHVARMAFDSVASTSPACLSKKAVSISEISSSKA